MSEPAFCKVSSVFAAASLNSFLPEHSLEIPAIVSYNGTSRSLSGSFPPEFEPGAASVDVIELMSAFNFSIQCFEYRVCISSSFLLKVSVAATKAIESNVLV